MSKGILCPTIAYCWVRCEWNKAQSSKSKAQMTGLTQSELIYRRERGGRRENPGNLSVLSVLRGQTHPLKDNCVTPVK